MSFVMFNKIKGENGDLSFCDLVFIEGAEKPEKITTYMTTHEVKHSWEVRVEHLGKVRNAWLSRENFNFILGGSVITLPSENVPQKQALKEDFNFTESGEGFTLREPLREKDKPKDKSKFQEELIRVTLDNAWGVNEGKVNLLCKCIDRMREELEKDQASSLFLDKIAYILEEIIKEY